MPQSRTYRQGKTSMYSRTSHKIGGRASLKSVKHTSNVELAKMLTSCNKKDINMINVELNRRGWVAPVEATEET